MKRILKRLKQQRGQMFILFAGVFAVVMVIAVISLDFGLWLSERRGAQTDADLPALAGAADLMVLDAGPAEAAAAEASVYEYVDFNDQSGNLGVENLVIDDSCFADNPRDRQGVPDSVTLDVSHDSGPLFSSIFGLAAPDIGAHAKACAGSLVGTTGLRPWTMFEFCSPCFLWNDDGDKIREDGEFTPRFGADCVFRSDGSYGKGMEYQPGTGCCEDSSSKVGSIGLGTVYEKGCNSGSGKDDYRDNIWKGSQAYCEIGDPIGSEPGLATGPTGMGMDRLLNGYKGVGGEGECDLKHCKEFGTCDGIDQFNEAFSPPAVVPSPDVTYSPRDCSTPRVVNIVIIRKFDKCTGQETQEIVGFAAFYVMYCQNVDGDGNPTGDPDLDCDSVGSHFQVVGRFMKKVELRGTGGPMDPFGTHVIFLAE